MRELSTAVHAAAAEAAAGNLARARDLLVDAVDAARAALGPGEIDAPPPLPLPPVGPPLGESIVADPERRRLPVRLLVAGVALVALLATLVAVWMIPQRGARTGPPSLAAPAGPSPALSAGGPSAGSSAVQPPSGTATQPGLPDAGTRTPPPRTTPGTTAPAAISGPYVIHVAHTGLCLGEGPELFVNSGRTVLGQHTCGSSLPQFTIEPVAANAYRILVTGRDGTGCADVDYQGTTDLLLLAAQPCTGAADQRFTLEPVTTPAVGYRLRSVAGSRFCIGVLEQKQQRGVQIMQDTCRGSKAEVFTLERR